MFDKQKEMDNVIRAIYEYVAEDDSRRRKESESPGSTLIVLCGDHGMNEVGNHGGSSEGETSTVCVFYFNWKSASTSPNSHLRPWSF